MSKTYKISNHSKLSYVLGQIYLTPECTLQAIPEDMVDEHVIATARVFKGVVIVEEDTNHLVAKGPEVEGQPESGATAKKEVPAEEPKAEEAAEAEEAEEEEVEEETPEEEETETEEDEPVEEEPEEEDDEDSAGSDWEDAEEEPEEAEEGDDEVDLDSMSDDELIDYAKAQGIKLGRTKKRDKVIAKILEAKL
jgi:hypothetical protein